ncbi:hypothetical protein H0261_02975 [Pectobacterium versatile]|uniref:hypothetical protein n=1 Tax=Pectobacterium versatile TaxID=2488639 RepID=UPI0015DDF88A|nr:hypothetical protein [Pectobacterium versatile]MBA0182694.1 hypothetical protein [Pectobacterium versatile]
MSDKMKFDNDNVISIKDAIYKKYPDCNNQNNSVYNKALTNDEVESLFICLSSLFFGLYSRYRESLNNSGQYSIMRLNSLLLPADDCNEIKVKGEISNEIRKTLMINMFDILIEFSFWNDNDYILYFSGSNEEMVDFIYKLIIPQSGLSYDNYKLNISLKSSRNFLGNKKIGKAHDLVIKNEATLNELTSQTRKLNNLKKEVNELEKKLNGLESTLQVNLLKNAFLKIKSDISEQLKNENEKYKKSVRATLFTPVIVTVFSIFLHVIFPFSMNLLEFQYTHIYNAIVNFSYETIILYSLPIIAFEIALFYFTRVIYVEIKSLKAQITQIDHRIASCEFIRSYMKQKNDHLEEIIKLSYNETVKNMFKDDGDGVGKFISFPSDFERLIFTPIQMTSDNIPAVLDGVNSIAELAGKVMSAKK